MFTNVNLAAPLGALSFLGGGLLLLVGAFVFVYALVSRRFGLARWVLVCGVVGVAIYLGTLLIFSLASSEKALTMGQEKHFCEIDCHLAYSIQEVRQRKTLGNVQNQTTAAGMFYVITVKTRFDETTISPSRGNGQLLPNSRVVTIIDERGRTFTPSVAGEQALATLEGVGTPLTSPLRPGETYTTKLAFDLPADVRGPRLLVREGELMTFFVIGHENSPLHKKTIFQL